MIDLTLNEDQRQILESVRGTLDRLAEQKLSVAQQWETLGSQGFFGLGLEESRGGAGFSVVEEALLAHEFGRSLAAPGYLATAAAAPLVPAGEGRLVAGERIVAFGLVSATDASAAWLIDAGEAEDILIRSGDGWVLEPASAFSGREALESLDTYGLERASAVLEAPGSGADEIALRIELMVAAAQAGLAEAAKEMSVAYAGTREQFGRPIGSFQAVAHHCADAAVRCEAARAQIYIAAVALRDGAPDAALQIAAAGAIADDAAFRNATINIRIHGGMGYSTETGADRLLKRCLTYRRLMLGEGWRRGVLLQPLDRDGAC